MPPIGGLKKPTALIPIKGSETPHLEPQTRVQHRDDKADLRSESDLVADRDVLPFRHDAIGAVDVAADEVFEKVVA
jgi:hypothetical protein